MGMKQGRIVHQVTGSEAIAGWAFEPDQDGEGGWLAAIFKVDGEFVENEGDYTYRVKSWVPGLLLATEANGQSVGRFFKSLFGRGARKARMLETAPGLYSKGETV